MNAQEYQKLALRTMADQVAIQHRLATMPVVAVQADNAMRGLDDEIGELQSVMKVWIEYGGKAPDPVNIKEEIGDCLWRLAQLADAFGLTLDKCMSANIDKLAKRYPDKYSDTLAHEENRNRDAEYRAVENSGGEVTAGASYPVSCADVYAPSAPIVPTTYYPLQASDLYPQNVETVKLYPDSQSYQEGFKAGYNKAEADAAGHQFSKSYRECEVCHEMRVHRSNTTSNICSGCAARKLNRE